MTTATYIGGHDGLEVLRQDGVIVKRALDEKNAAALLNESRVLAALHECSFAPQVILRQVKDEGSACTLIESDLGESEPVRDGERFRRTCTAMLYALRQHNVRHGDLTASNIIVRGDVPYVVDWHEAHFLDELAPQKSPYSDSFLLMRSLSQWEDADWNIDASRVSRRWGAILQTLGAGSDLSLPLRDRGLVDLGCYQGDFCALAVCEGMAATGIDRGGFRSGENSISLGRELWRDSLGVEHDGGLYLVEHDVLDWQYPYDVTLFLSTWPYLVRDYGREIAEEYLAGTIQRSAVLFFETQIAGDGPGPEWLTSQEDVADLLQHLGGAPEPILTLPIDGRDAERVTWKVTPR